MNDRTDGTRARLLDATAAVMLERGWGGVTTRAVAERAGVRPGLVHYHFGSIDELRREAVVGALHEVFEPFIELAATMTPIEVMDALAEASTTDFAPGTDVTNLLYEALPATTRDPALRDELAELLARFRTLLADAIRRHHPAPLVEPDLLAELIGAAIDGLQLHLLAEPDLDLAGHLRALVPLLGPDATTEEP